MQAQDITTAQIAHVAETARTQGAALAHDAGTLYLRATVAQGKGIEACHRCSARPMAGDAIVYVVESPTCVGYMCAGTCVDDYVAMVSGQGAGTWCALAVIGGRMVAGDPMRGSRAMQAQAARDAEQVETGADVAAAITVRHAVATLQAADVAATVVQDDDGTVRVYAGDDAERAQDALQRTGTDAQVHCMHVGCSAHCTHDAEPGTDAPHLQAGGTVLVAIDCNGQDNAVAHACRRHAVGFRQATGVYGGDALPSILAMVDAEQVPALHAALRATVTGYGCAAIMVDAAQVPA